MKILILSFTSGTNLATSEGSLFCLYSTFNHLSFRILCYGKAIKVLCKTCVVKLIEFFCGGAVVEAFLNHEAMDFLISTTPNLEVLFVMIVEFI